MWPWETAIVTSREGVRELTLTEYLNWQHLFAWIAEDPPRWDWPPRPD